MSLRNEDTLAAISSLERRFVDGLASFEARMAVAKPTPTNMEQLANEFAAFKLCMLQAVELLRAQMTAFSVQLDDIDNTGRRKFLCLLGINELPSEDLRSRVADLARQKLGLKDFSVDDIKSAYRLGKASTNTPARPRPILVKFASMAVRSQIWHSKKALKGSGITLTEFLTPRRRELFLEARRRHGIHSCWSLDGVVYMKLKDGERIRLDTLQQLDASGAKYPVTAPPASPALQADGTSGRSRRHRSLKKQRE